MNGLKDVPVVREIYGLQFKKRDSVRDDESRVFPLESTDMPFPEVPGVEKPMLLRWLLKLEKSSPTRGKPDPLMILQRELPFSSFMPSMNWAELGDETISQYNASAWSIDKVFVPSGAIFFCVSAPKCSG